MRGLLFECALRAVLIALGTALVLRLMRVKTSAARHGAWAGVVLLMLLLPIWTALGPKLMVPVLPHWPQWPVGLSAAPLIPPSETPSFSTDSQATQSAGMHEGWDWFGFALGVYLLGLGVLLLRLTIGTLRTRALLRDATICDGFRISRYCFTPVTVGWLRPAVILPETWRQWPEAKRNAILAHEQEHARRRDPLIQWLALLNRALFWFHPLAWWLERRLSTLSEEVCDAAVISRGHDPRDYSEYLLDIARSVQRSGSRVQIWGMEISGSSLSHRIRRILEVAPLPRVSRLRIICASAACAVASIMFATAGLDHARAQLAPATRPITTSASPAGSDFDKRRIRHVGLDWQQLFRALVAEAYGVEEFQVALPSAWSERQAAFDYPAQEQDGVFTQTHDTPTLKDIFASRDFLNRNSRGNPTPVRQQLLQSELLERFHLLTHRERRSVLLFALVASPNVSDTLRPEDGHGGCRFGPGRLYCQKAGISFLALHLSNFLQRPVIDRTNLKGAYTYGLDWTPGEPEMQRFLAPNLRGNPDAPPSPSLVTALDRLGLKLEAVEEMLDMIVVDHVGR